MSTTQSNTQRAVSELRRMIFDAELSPGSDHLETELADMLGMSRTPIREAILVLAEQGLVVLRPRRGIRVMAISVEDMRDIYDVLTELESLAAENAALQRYSPQDLSVMYETIEAMDTALAKDDRIAWARADNAFHKELVRLGKNARIEMIATMMEDQVRRAKSITLHMRPTPLKSNRDHRELLTTIQAGDPIKARELHHAHRRGARNVLIELLVRHGLKRV
ncbi:MAG: GntR family transcriptional regulator [Paracoccaceae bacterium]